MDCKKSNKITEIVRLQQILKKWRKIANSSKTSSSSIPANNNNNNTSGSKSIKFLKRTLSLSESSGAGGRGVPKGFLAVSVGEEQKRFTIPTEYLSHSAFHILLREAEEEFGFQQAGILRIPCEVAVFESVLRIVEDKKDGVVGGYGYCLLTGQQTPTHHPQSPMCR
ncbi:Protein SMALL AUXIN UP-REGULATED RNA 12 [Linum grandiflorum]